MHRLFFRPQAASTGKMWDTWLYWHEGVYYLYYLANVSDKWDNISLATSTDGVSWQEHGPVLVKEPGAVWMGTGSTWKSPHFARDGKFFMNYSLSQSGQRICLAESKDLIHWTPLGPATTTRPDTRWYKISNDDTARWDCIFTALRDEGGLWGWWTATPLAHTGVGFGWSADGCTWEALPPPVLEPLLGEAHCEHGGVARVGSHYYHMIGVNGNMTAYVADGPCAPLRRATVNPLLLGNEGAWHTYFTRFFPVPDGLLVNHHAIGRDGMVYFGLLKRALIDAVGTLRLGWWEGNDALRKERQPLAWPEAGKRVAGLNLRLLPDPLPTAGGIMLEGRIELPCGAAQEDACGLFIRTAPNEGTAILMAPDGSAKIGRLPLDGGGFERHIRIDREFNFGRAPAFRLVLKRDLLEFYLADILIHCYSLPAPCDGSLGVIGEASGLCVYQ
jgi:hypothetical protein